jgi:hypothetical protein
MREALSVAHLGWLLPGFLSFGVVLLLSALRWFLLMRAQNITLPFSRVYQLSLIGMFFNLCLPGGVGGDFVKVFFAMREAPKSKSAVLLSIVVDRATGMFALILISAGIFLHFYSQLMALPIIRPFLFTVGFIFAAFLGLVVSGILIDRLKLASKLPSKMPGYAAIMDIARAFSVYARSWGSVAAAVALSVALNVFFFASAIFASFAFSGNPGASAMISVVPIVNTISALPISVAGVGVRESLFSVMLHSLYGTPKELAVLISLTGFSLIVAWGLLGGIVYLIYRPANASEAFTDTSLIAQTEGQIEAEELSSSA